MACYLRVRRRRLFSSSSRAYEISIPANSVANIRTFLNIPKRAPRCGRFSHPIKLPHPITLPLYNIMNARVRAGRGQAMRRMKQHPSNAGRMGRIGEKKKRTYIGRRVNLYETVAFESCPLLIVLRHRALSSPICLSEVLHKSFALSHVFLLLCGGKSVLLVKGKVHSHSGFLLSMYVVLKTRYVSPNIHVRRY